MNKKEEFLKNCIVVDTETNSKDYKVAEVIELGYALYINGEYGQFSQLYKPEEGVSPEVSAITNITNEMLVECEQFTKENSGLTELVETVGPDAVMIAHNSFYDMNVLLRYGIKHDRWICTLRLARKLYGKDQSVTQFNLPYLRYRFNVLNPAYYANSAHRAGDDAHVTSLLLSKFVDEMISQGLLTEDEPYADQIMHFIDAPILVDIMPFGKHKGKLLKDIPLDYWNWAFKNMDSLNEEAENFDKDFAASVAAVLGEIL